MGFFTDVLGGSKDPKPFGGGFDPAIKPFIEGGLEGLQSAYLAGPRVYQGERVAGFDPAQVAAQSSLIALATGQPDYYAPAIRNIEEAISLSRQAARPITAAEIAAQRKLLEPTAEAQRLAQKQAYEGAIRDIGVGAGGAGVGALEGARADILRGGAAGELALSLANIEGGLQERSLLQAGAERDRQARLPSQLAALSQQGLQIGQEGFAEQIERTGLQAGVGAERRGLEQQRIAAEMAEFGEYDPFTFAQQYLSTIYGAPTRQTQYTQEPSTFQEIVGLGTMAAGFSNKGGSVRKNAGGPLLKLIMSSGGGKDMTLDDVDSAMASVGSANYENGGGILSRFTEPFRRAYNNTTGGAGIFSKEEEDEIKEIEDFSDEMFGTDYASEREKKKKKNINPSQAMASVGSKTITPNDSVMFAKQRAARQALGMRKNGGGIASLQTGSTPLLKGGSNPYVDSNIPNNVSEMEAGIERLRRQRQLPDEPNAFQRILSGVGSGLQSIGSGIKTGVKYYADNLDPFGPAGANLTREERIRVGLGILAAQPELGESALTTTARGALLGLASVDDLDDGTFTPRITTVPNSEYEVIDEGVSKLQKTSTKIGADKRVSLRRAAEDEATAGIYAGTVRNDPASYRTEVLRIYRQKVKDAYKKPVEEGGFEKPTDKGSATQAIDTSSEIASMTPKGKK